MQRRSLDITPPGACAGRVAPAPDAATAQPPRARVFKPLPKVLGWLGLEAAAAAAAPACERLRFAPGEPLCDAGARRRASFVIGRGLVLRREPDGSVRIATAIAGPRELIGDGLRAGGHAPRAVAITPVEAFAIDARALDALDRGDALLGRIVAGPQSVACLRHWVRHVARGDLGGERRVLAGLGGLADLLGDEPSALADIVLGCGDLAQWLAMPATAVRGALQQLHALGVLRFADPQLLGIDAEAMRRAAAFSAGDRQGSPA